MWVPVGIAGDGSPLTEPGPFLTIWLEIPRSPSQSDEELLAAARDVFLREGASASLRTVAKQTGITHAAILQRFGSKRDLMIAALGPSESHPRDRLRDGPDDRPVREQLLQLLDAGEANLARTLPSTLVLQSAGIAPGEVFRIEGEPTFKLTHRALTSWMHQATRRGLLTACDVEALSVALSGMAMVRTFRKTIFGETGDRLTRSRYIEASIDLLLEGVSPGETSMNATHDDEAEHIASEIFANLQEAWNDGNGDSFGAPFAEDADFVDLRGAHHRSRDAIANGHQAILDSIYKGSRVRYEVTTARNLTPDTVLAHVSGTLDAPTGPLAGTHACTVSAILARAGERWEITSFHNTLCIS